MLRQVWAAGKTGSIEPDGLSSLTDMSYSGDKRQKKRLEVDDSLSELKVAEINAEIPRRLRLDGLTIKVLTGALLTLLAGIGLLVWIANGTLTGLHTRDILRRDGQLAYGDITKVSVNRGGEDVRYSFLVDGVLYSGYAEMQGEHYTVPGDSKKIPLCYLPNDPRVNQPTNWQWVSVWDFFPFLLLFAIMAVAARAIIMALRLATLARMGVVVIGKVIGCAPNKKLFTIYYEFTGKDNAVVEGKCDLLDEYETGTSIPIIFLRSNPKRNTRYPISGFRTAT